MHEGWWHGTCNVVFFYPSMKDDSLHHDYMCLVTVHSWNLTVWWRKSFPCGSSRGVEILGLRKVSWGESHPGWTLPVRGFSSNLLQLSSGGKKFWGKRLAQRRELNASFSWCHFHADFTQWKNLVMLKSVTALCPHRNKNTREARGHILLRVFVDLHMSQLKASKRHMVSFFPSNSFHKAWVFYCMRHIWSSFVTASFQHVSSFFLSRVGNHFNGWFNTRAREATHSCMLHSLVHYAKYKNKTFIVLRCCSYVY